MRRDWVWVNTSYNPRIDVFSQQLDIALPVHFWDVNHWVLGNSLPYSKRHSKTYPKHRWLPRSRTDVVARHRRSGAIRSAAGASAEEQGLVVFPWVDQFTAFDSGQLGPMARSSQGGEVTRKMPSRIGSICLVTSSVELRRAST